MDIDFMTNEDIDPIGLLQYLMENPPVQNHPNVQQLGDGNKQ